MIHVCITLGLIAVSAFFSASETALFSIERYAVAGFSRGDFRDRAIYRLLNASEETLITILIVNLFVNLFIINQVEYLVSVYVGESLLLSFAAATGVLLVFGEILPKNWAVSHSRSYARFCAPLLDFFRTSLTLIVRIFQRINQKLLYFNSSYILRSPAPFVTDHEYLSALQRSREKSELSSHSYDFMRRFMQVCSRPVSVCALHRFRVKDIPDLQVEAVFGRIAPQKIRYREQDISAHWFSLHRRIGELLDFFKEQSCDAVLVNDEYGDYYGVCRLKDILEYWKQREESRAYSPEFPVVLSGKDHLVLYEKYFPKKMVQRFRNVKTVNGVVTSWLGFIPRRGYVFGVESYIFEIIRANQRCIESIQIRRRSV
ncbi:MAG: CNNM domain-containing protein [Fibrobacterota bacterium]